MLGLIKKDFLLIKANSKSMIIIFIIYLMMAFQGTFDVTFIVPLIGIMLFIPTFSYDDFNNWNSYAVTLPDGRKNVVRAKYIASIILTIILGIVSLAIGVGIDYAKTNSINLDETISSLMGTVLSSVIIISLLYPIVFKFGATNGSSIWNSRNRSFNFSICRYDLYYKYDKWIRQLFTYSNSNNFCNITRYLISNIKQNISKQRILRI